MYYNFSSNQFVCGLYLRDIDDGEEKGNDNANSDDDYVIENVKVRTCSAVCYAYVKHVIIIIFYFFFFIVISFTISPALSIGLP